VASLVMTEQGVVSTPRRWTSFESRDVRGQVNYIPKVSKRCQGARQQQAFTLARRAHRSKVNLFFVDYCSSARAFFKYI
jgi:hypothetical protein